MDSNSVVLWVPLFGALRRPLFHGYSRAPNVFVRQQKGYPNHQRGLSIGIWNTFPLLKSRHYESPASIYRCP